MGTDLLNCFGLLVSVSMGYLSSIEKKTNFSCTSNLFEFDEKEIMRTKVQ
jgi:hypothetical protein